MNKDSKQLHHDRHTVSLLTDHMVFALRRITIKNQYPPVGEDRHAEDHALNSERELHSDTTYGIKMPLENPFKNRCFSSLDTGFFLFGTVCINTHML